MNQLGHIFMSLQEKIGYSRKRIVIAYAVGYRNFPKTMKLGRNGSIVTRTYP